MAKNINLVIHLRNILFLNIATSHGSSFIYLASMFYRHVIYIIQNLDSFFFHSLFHNVLSYVVWRQYSFYHFSPFHSTVGVDHLIVFKTNLFILSLVVSSARRHSFLSSPLPRSPSSYFRHWLLDYIHCPNEFIPQRV